jgi:hypothetical protein
MCINAHKDIIINYSPKALLFINMLKLI